MIKTESVKGTKVHSTKWKTADEYQKEILERFPAFAAEVEAVTMTDYIYIPVSGRVPAGTLAQSFTPDGAPGPIATTPPVDLEIGDVCLLNYKTGELLQVLRGGTAVINTEVSDG